MTRPRLRGTIEYLKADVTDHEAEAVEDASLDGTIAFSIDEGQTWLDAEWVGDVFLKATDDGLRATRVARTQQPVDTTALTEPRYDVWVKLTDSPETPIMRAGTLRLI